MATLYTHAVVGLGLGIVFARTRRPFLYWSLTALLPIIPDLDTFTTYSYGSLLGHRGFTHSLIFALWMGAFTASLTFRFFKMNFWALTGIFSLIIGSHPILDAFTFGGFGIPFFWPFDQSRYGNWGPISVADIGFEVPDPRTSRAIQSELLWVWLPTIILVSLITTYRCFRRARQENQAQV